MEELLNHTASRIALTTSGIFFYGGFADWRMEISLHETKSKR